MTMMPSGSSSSSAVCDETAHRRALPFRVAIRRVQAWRKNVHVGGYALAAIFVLFAFLLRLLLDPWLGDQSTYLPFVVAVALTGLYAGVRPALLAAALGTVVAYFCFVPPRYRWGFAGLSDAVAFGVYVLSVAGVILLTHARIRAAEKAEQQRIETEEILLKTERLSAAGQMAFLLAHEINNPLAALTNITYLLNQQSLGSPSKELISAGTDALGRINRIAGMTMRFFSDKDAPVPVRIGEMVNDVAETLTSAERFKNIHYVPDFRANPVLVASPARIKQLIASLLTNAMESGASTVRVRVDVGARWRSPSRHGARITIADNGRGIQARDREKVFEPFISSKSEKGAGLGLWASRAVVLRNDGEIRLRSAVMGPGKGTTISVFLPTLFESEASLLDTRRSAVTTK